MTGTGLGSLSVSARRAPIPDAVRSEVLIRNGHACCACQRVGVQIHHIDGDATNNTHENLAALCHDHHDRATAPAGLLARLKPNEVRSFKQRWEMIYANDAMRVARGRTAFFMVDYKNPDRLRQLFVQIPEAAFGMIADELKREFIQETDLRETQGFSISLEPTTEWSKLVEYFVECVRRAIVHPPIFENMLSHPADSWYPKNMTGQYFQYDIWSQIIARALVIYGGPYDLNSLLLIDDPMNAGLAGRLVTIEGKMSGNVQAPSAWEKKPTSEATLTLRAGNTRWKSKLHLRTHYVYSDTAAESLSAGTERGLLLIRSVENVVDRPRKNRTVEFSAIPLILGSGGGGSLQIPKEPMRGVTH